MAEIILSTVPREKSGKRISQTASFCPTIGIAYLTSVLKSAGHNVVQKDPGVGDISIDDLAEAVASESPLLFGMGCFTLDVFHAGSTAQKVKALNPKIKIVLGGTHPTALPEQTLQEFPAVDFVVFGEGERTVPELVDALKSEGRFADIPGLAYRDDDRIIRNPDRELIEDLDSLPFPDYSGLPLNRYRTQFPWKGGTCLPVGASRGCPYSCIFCYGMFGVTLRGRSPESVVEEMERNLLDYQAPFMIMADETFTARKSFVTTACERLIAKGLHEKIRWWCSVRENNVDPELFRLLHRAGCRLVTFGVESGDEEVLARIHKNISLDKTKKAVQWAHEAGVKTQACYIFGHPEETPTQAQRTIRASVDINSTYAMFAIITPYPGTEIWDMVQKGEGGYILLSKDWRDYTKSDAVSVELKTLPHRRLVRLLFAGYMRFYLRPTRLYRMIEGLGFLNIVRYLWYSTVAGFLKVTGRQRSS